MKINPIGDNVVVLLLDEEVRASGIIVPDAAKNKPERGKVVAVGPGKTLNNGQRRNIDVKEGDIVLFKQYSIEEFDIDGVKMSVIDANDIIATLNN